ncbi:MAG: hypothetical protein ABGW87_08250 [Sphingomonadaceae bacterium]
MLIASVAAIRSRNKGWMAEAVRPFFVSGLTNKQYQPVAKSLRSGFAIRYWGDDEAIQFRLAQL